MSELTPGAKPAVLRCGRCGRFVDWETSRLQVVCGCRPHLELPPVFVREASDADRDRVATLFARHFGAARVTSDGAIVPLDRAAALVAEVERDVAGALAWRALDDAIHVLAVATDPMWQRAGVGGHLLAEAELLARHDGRSRVLVTVTNDNIPAWYFYQRHGYRVSTVLVDSIATHTPGDSIGFAGIPIRDEIQLVKVLGGS